MVSFSAIPVVIKEPSPLLEISADISIPKTVPFPLFVTARPFTIPFSDVSLILFNLIFILLEVSAIHYKSFYYT